MLKKIERRAAILEKWLNKYGPTALTDQRHLDEGSTERVYWHYGYLMALRDVLAIIINGQNQDLDQDQEGRKAHRSDISNLSH